MKKTLAVFLLLAVCLLGCNGENDALSRAMHLRTSLLHANECTFEAQITAEFAEGSFTFAMLCRFDVQGNMTFCVKSPESIADITGSISASGGALTFDDTALAFPLMGGGSLSPVSAPYLLFTALRAGYVRCGGADGEYTRITIDESFAQDAQTLDVWLGADDLPVQADIYEENRRTLTLTIENFSLA